MGAKCLQEGNGRISLLELYSERTEVFVWRNNYIFIQILCNVFLITSESETGPKRVWSNISSVFRKRMKNYRSQATIFRTQVLPSFFANVYMSELIIVNATEWIVVNATEWIAAGVGGQDR